MMMSSALSRSSSSTLPLPMPIVSESAEPLDSWHMFEQSGRLLVPELAHEQLVGERRFVAGAARRVEHGFIGAREGVQLTCNQVERVVPLEGLIVPTCLRV